MFTAKSWSVLAALSLMTGCATLPSTTVPNDAVQVSGGTIVANQANASAISQSASNTNTATAVGGSGGGGGGGGAGGTAGFDSTGGAGGDGGNGGPAVNSSEQRNRQSANVRQTNVIVNGSSGSRKYYPSKRR